MTESAPADRALAFRAVVANIEKDQEMFDAAWEDLLAAGGNTIAQVVAILAAELGDVVTNVYGRDEALARMRHLVGENTLKGLQHGE